MNATNMVTVYRLRQDKQQIDAVQRATSNTWKFGVAQTHGLFGSDEWWSNIESGKLVIYTLRGTIGKIYLGGMRDTPEFIMRSEDGKETSWLRCANNKELDDFYAVGRRIEVDYVLQRHRFFSGLNYLRRHKIVLEIRIGEGAAIK